MEGSLSGWPTECRYCRYAAPKDIAVATTFWHWMGYNFGCMIASDTLPRVGFLGSCYPMNTANFEVLRDVAVATIFWLSIYGVHIGATWRI